MFKKLILFISFVILALFDINELRAEENIIVPLKKPELTIQELNKKVLINILKPLAKPNQNKEKVKTVENIKKEKIKVKVILPKKNTS